MQAIPIRVDGTAQLCPQSNGSRQLIGGKQKMQKTGGPLEAL